MSAQELEQLIQRLEAVATRIENAESRNGAGAAPSGEGLSSSHYVQLVFEQNPRDSRPRSRAARLHRDDA